MREVQLRRWTRGEYDRMIEAGVLTSEDRVELINGDILSVTPQGSRHATAITLCAKAVGNVVRPDCHVRVQLPLALDDLSEPEPDVAVVAGSSREYRDAHPASALGIIEVADVTLAFDRQQKSSLYARAGIPEYWILNLIEQRLEIYVDPRPDSSQGFGWGYELADCYGAGQSVSPRFAPDAGVAVSDLLP